MKIYVVVHDPGGYDDRAYIRAVFLTRESAKAHCIKTDPCTMPSHLDGSKPHETQWHAVRGCQVTDENGCWMADIHESISEPGTSRCCDVEEWEAAS
jgi:hypothetical protein